MEQWKEYKYSELATIIGGGTPKTAIQEYWNGNIPWLSVKDFGNDDKYVYTTEKSITELGLNNSPTNLLKHDDIIISARGTVGELSMIPFPMSFNQSCFGIRAKEHVNPHFLYYLTKTKIRELKNNSHGSVFDTITRATFDSIICNVPNLDEQKRIADFLSSLDDKIELNRRINDNLEQQAQALFKSWFVDFEPFKDGEFVDSELGMIPKGWRVGVLGEVAEFKRGKTITQKDTKVGNIPVIAGGLEPAYYHNIANTTAPVVTISASGANAGFTQILFDDVWASDCSYIDSQCAYLLFAYCFLSVNTRILRHAQVGAAQPHVYAKDVNAFKIALPNDSNIISDFISIIEPIFNHIANNRKNNSTLSIVRDTLLPRLMSGELKINDLNC